MNNQENKMKKDNKESSMLRKEILRKQKLSIKIRRKLLTEREKLAVNMTINQSNILLNQSNMKSPAETKVTNKDKRKEIMMLLKFMNKIREAEASIRIDLTGVVGNRDSIRKISIIRSKTKEERIIEKSRNIKILTIKRAMAKSNIIKKSHKENKEAAVVEASIEVDIENIKIRKDTNKNSIKRNNTTKKRNNTIKKRKHSMFKDLQKDIRLENNLKSLSMLKMAKKKIKSMRRDPGREENIKNSISKKRPLKKITHTKIEDPEIKEQGVEER